MTGNLTPKQEAFCLKYIETGNASEAYRQAYNSGGMKPTTVNRNAFSLLDNSKVAARIASLKEAQLKRHNVTVDRVLKEYARLAFLDPRKLFDESGNLRPIHDMDDDTVAAITGLEVDKKLSKFGDEEGNPLVESHLHKIRFSDKKGALDSLAKHLKMFSDAAVVNVTAVLPERDKALLDEYVGKAD